MVWWRRWKDIEKDYFMQQLESLKLLFEQQPAFVRESLHFHLFKTAFLYEKLYSNDARNNVSKLEINPKLWMFLSLIPYAESYINENGKYHFVIRKNMFGFKGFVPFLLLMKNLIEIEISDDDIANFYFKLYNSKNPILVLVAENLRNEHISLSFHLIEFLTRRECSKNFKWTTKDILSGSWNYTLLAINENVYKTVLNDDFLQVLFQVELKESNYIDEGNLMAPDYVKYVRKIDSQIINKLQFHGSK